MQIDASGYAAIAQAVIIFFGTIAALRHYSRDIKQRTFRDSLAMEASLSETRASLFLEGGGKFEIKLLAHMERLELISAAINKRYLKGIAREFAVDVVKNDLGGLLYIIDRDDRHDLITRFVTSKETFSDIAKFYKIHQTAIKDRAKALNA